VEYRIYADDVQLFVVAHPDQVELAFKKLEKCIASIQKWLQQISLCLNLLKTEAIALGSPGTLKKCNFRGIKVGDVVIQLKTVVRDLGVMIDSQLSMQNNVLHICRKAFLQLKLISRHSRSMNFSTRLQAVQSLVLPHLDFSISTMIGVNCKLIQKLQWVLNSCMRFVYRLKKRQSVDMFLRKHLWMSVSSRIQFRTLCIAHSVIYGRAPDYLKATIAIREPPRTLRSNSSILLEIPRITSRLGERAFSVAAVKFWNQLPSEMRSISSPSKFRQSLITFLLTQ
jgi:hypothetical protein